MATKRFHDHVIRGLRCVPSDAVHAHVIEQRWRWPTVLALAGTVPAFYLELLQEATPLLAQFAYAVAASILVAALLHTAWHSKHSAEHRKNNLLDLVLVLGLLAAAWLPPSSGSPAALTLRLVVALITLLRMVWALRHLLTRGGLVYLLLSAAIVLGLCGVGFWWLEPKALTLGDGLWLAFTTAATVGYGDLVPSTAASKIFSVFVMMLGFGVLSLVTAAIATRWIETEERLIKREILRDMHHQMAILSQEIASLRRDVMLTTAVKANVSADVRPDQD
jgi:voltage-gated potassium channel